MMSIRSKLSSLGMKCLNGWVFRRQGHTLVRKADCVPIKVWNDGIIDMDSNALKYVTDLAKMKEIWHPQGLAVMPSLHLLEKSCIGVVLASSNTVIPSLVGTDLGCGIMAVQLSLTANQLPENLLLVRKAIEALIPAGKESKGFLSHCGIWWKGIPKNISECFDVHLLGEFNTISSKLPIPKALETAYSELGTLGAGSHFFELNLDENNNVWLTVHSGSRGVGSIISKHHTKLAQTERKKLLKKTRRNPGKKELAYFTTGTECFDGYLKAVSWAQKYAKINRELIMEAGIKALRCLTDTPPFEVYSDQAVHCHHNYVSLENHFGEDLYITRRGGIRAAKGMLGVIPGSMGANSFIVRGLGNPDSYETCSHGAGRRMSRTAAKKVFSVKDHTEATKNVECRKDAAVVDETPGAYKPIEAVIAAQKDLVEVVHTLRQIVCVKG